MVFKSAGDSLSAAAPTWAFSTSARHVIQDHPAYIPRGQRWPLRPELAAVLGGWPLPQLTEGVGDSQCLLLSGVVAVLGCCIVTARTLQGMARVRSGQAPAWPLVSDRSVRRGSRVKHDFACAFTSHFYPCSLSGGHSHA
jgi:hypothetical protein